MKCDFNQLYRTYFSLSLAIKYQINEISQETLTGRKTIPNTLRRQEKLPTTTSFERS